MKWILASDKLPDGDMKQCAVVVKKGVNIYVLGYPVFYTTTGFLHPNVVAWAIWPEHFIDNKTGWIQTAERYPDKPGCYFVSTYNDRGQKRVVQAGFDEKHQHFYGCGNDDIAWMPIPSVEVLKEK